jgi:adenylosuccinate lyase
MTTSMNDSALFYPMWRYEEMAAIWDDRAIAQYWLDIEKALAQTQAELGIIPKEAAEQIAKNADASTLDLVELGNSAAKVGHALVPVLRAVEKACENNCGEYIHLGATTQDITDTGYMMAMKRGFALIYRDLRDVELAALKLADKYKDTVMAGRTHGQQALPITFGYKAAIWASEIRRDIERMKECWNRDFVGQMSGAVGTMAGFGENGHLVGEGTIAKVGLDVPNICWHTSRDRMTTIMNMITLVSYTMAHIGHECACLMKNEFGEVAEGFVRGQVFSSTMPNKRNPGLCEITQALARLAKASADATTNSMFCEHERDASVWRIEWRSLGEGFMSVGTCVMKAKKLLDGLQVFPERMRKNLDLTNGLMFAEPVMLTLGKAIGKQTAHEVVYEISMDCFEKDIPFIEGLLANETVAKHLSREQLENIMRPENYTGESAYFAEKVVKEIYAAREHDALD